VVDEAGMLDQDSDLERSHALAVKASLPDPPLVVAHTREQVAALNSLVHQLRLTTGEATHAVVIGCGAATLPSPGTPAPAACPPATSIRA
jgi:hypothetical protein